MAFGLAGIVELLLAPPGLSIWLMLAGIWLLYRGQRARLGLGLAGSGLILLYLFSTPLVAQLLLSGLQTAPAIPPAELDERDAQAIVVLGAGRREDASEYGADTLNSLALERLRYAAFIARRTELPVLVSGGLAKDGHPPEAMLLAEALKAEFGIPVRWVESDSRTTYENARYSSQILRGAGIQRAFLVSHAWHMPRALWSFEQFGMELIPAPTAFDEWGDGGMIAQDFLPGAHALRKTAYAFHEYLGNLWYRLRRTLPKVAPAPD